MHAALDLRDLCVGLFGPLRREALRVLGPRGGGDGVRSRALGLLLRLAHARVRLCGDALGLLGTGDRLRGFLTRGGQAGDRLVGARLRRAHLVVGGAHAPFGFRERGLEVGEPVPTLRPIGLDALARVQPRGLHLGLCLRLRSLELLSVGLPRLLELLCIFGTNLIELLQTFGTNLLELLCGFGPEALELVLHPLATSLLRGGGRLRFLEGLGRRLLGGGRRRADRLELGGKLLAPPLLTMRSGLELGELRRPSLRCPLGVGCSGFRFFEARLEIVRARALSLGLARHRLEGCLELRDRSVGGQELSLEPGYELFGVHALHGEVLESRVRLDRGAFELGPRRPLRLE